MVQDLIIKKASIHNLKDINVKIPRNTFCVITGLSGSGKSSLAFDTIYAEGHRRYVESLSAYARQFLGKMNKPPVEYIEGLSPAISIDQKAPTHNPRSTVGTITEIYDYFRLLFARAGTPHCPKCGDVVQRQTVEEIAGKVKSEDWDGEVRIWSKIIDGMKGEHKGVFQDLFDMGYLEGRVDGKMVLFDEPPELERYKKHDIEVIIDSWQNDIEKSRLLDSLEKGLHLSKGSVTVSDGNVALPLSEQFACAKCGISFEEPQPRNFSFNNPHGACTSCSGLGYTLQVDPDLVVVDKKASIDDGAFGRQVNMGSWMYRMWETVADHYGFSLDTPYEELPDKAKKVLLYGSDEPIQFNFAMESGNGSWSHESFRKTEGLVNRYARLYKQTKSRYMRDHYESFMSQKTCRECRGRRLQDVFLAVTVGEKNISQISTMSIEDAVAFFKTLELSGKRALIGKPIVKEIIARLEFMSRVGLSYLTLDRPGMTLSGGENQRIRLASQIGSGLVGVLYVLDEPSIGLHQRDNARLIQTLMDLRDAGNTILVVEHDEETIRTADFVVDLGPGAGVHGGEVVAMGPPLDIMKEERSLTGQYLKGDLRIGVPAARRDGKNASVELTGCRENNLQSIDVELPLGKFICITGVSGSGKSTFMNTILHKSLARELHNSKARPGAFDDILGLEAVDKVVMIDQSPIGRTPRSNPVTYTKIFDDIRDLFASTTEAKKLGYKKGRFSFNVKGGRCEKCRGAGTVKIEMHFLPDVYVECEACGGKRYNDATLDVRYKGKNIHEVLDMTIEEALDFFRNIPKVKRKLQTVFDVGLGYMKMGQPATTLSGGEAQRIKLASELMRVSTGDTVYLLDEPTTGLHIHDIKKLLSVLHRLADAGNTVVVIEHQMDVIKNADHIIDLGPEGGDEGGRVVAEGTPEEIARSGTHTGRFLKKHLA